ncbi:hypothetical protein ACFLT6_00235 [Chloroflexota bacterium]
MHIKQLVKVTAIFSFVSVWLIFALLGCTNDNLIKAPLDEEFSLAIGQTVQISGENIKIKLTDVINDSRCPEGANCIVAGEVTSLLDITINGEIESFPLVVSGAGGVGSHVYQDNNLNGNVVPYPKLGVEIQRADYRLNMTVSKTKTSAMEIQPAPIHEVDIRFAESYPVQIFVYIKGGLRDGCTTFKEVNTARKDTTVEIDVSV